MSFRSRFRDSFRDSFRSAIAAAQRIFITVNGVDEYFTFQNTKTFPDDFDLSIDAVLPTAATTVTLFGQTASAAHYIKVLSSGFVSINIDTSIVTSTVLATKDNKQRRYGVRLVGNDFIFTEDGATIDTVTDAVAAAKSLIINAIGQSNGADFFSKTLSDPILNDLTTASNSVSWQLNRALPATTEQSTDGTNLLTYVGAPKTELFTFNQSANQWENAFFPNLLLRSEEFDNDVWTKSSGVSVSPNATLAPGGSLTADELTPTTGGNFVEVSQNVSVTIGQPCTQTYFVKDNGLQFIQVIGPSSIFGTFNVNFDVVNDIITQSNAGTSTGLISSITSAANGFFRIRVTVDALANSSNGRLALDFIKTGTTGRGVNEGDFNGTDSIFAWGGQFVKGVSPLNYKKTVDIAGRSIEIA